MKPSAERKQSVLGFEHATVCLKTIMDQCYTPISPTDEQVLFLNAPEVMQHIRTEGCLTDLFLDSIGIPKLPDGRHIDRDGLVPWRRHAYMMSHAYSRTDFIDYIQIRNDNNDPSIQQQRKDRAQALKVINRAAVVRQRIEDAAGVKVVKDGAKATEKSRRDHLTVGERRSEDQLKKAQVAATKLAKAQAVERELAQAILLLQ